MEKKIKIIGIYEENVCPICGGELIYSAENPDKHIVPWHCDCCKATGDLAYRDEHTNGDDDPNGVWRDYKVYGPNVNVHLKDGTPVELVDPNSPDAGPLVITGTCEEGVCPVCGGTLTYNGCKEDDDNGCTYPWVCDKCGATGKEGYTLSFDGNHYDVETARGIPVKIAAPKVAEDDDLPWYPNEGDNNQANDEPVKAVGGWFIPVTWEMCGVVRIPFEEAATLAEAIEKVRNDNSDIPLPPGDYVDDSFVLTYDDEDEIRTLHNDGRPDMEVAE